MGGVLGWGGFYKSMLKTGLGPRTSAQYKPHSQVAQSSYRLQLPTKTTILYIVYADRFSHDNAVTPLAGFHGSLGTTVLSDSLHK